MTDNPNKLFVGGLSANTDDDGLRQHFERFGELIDHVVIKHKVQSRSRCFGFVTYAKPEQAAAAMAARPHTVDGTAVEGSSYGGYSSYGNDARFYDNGGYSGTYTCGHCGHENLSRGWNVYNGYGQCYSGYGPNNGYFGGQSTAPFTGGW
ncbi:Heterogeneous nuclear ribonucleoprotein A0 [Oryzias melastigma]|uniref:Heterogeneous nuclear ribonucleoprotein A0 n=1 Tax=Oryzias melastigma TaxID=30732 RepID=A0A834CPE0_ORYME|nr:Heterogeneous nuclear ribonucleoprotein A0 [Oryzias melastigma]